MLLFLHASTKVSCVGFVLRCPFREIATALQATSRNDIKCFARSGISDVTYSTLSVIEQSNAATNPYFVNTSYASFLTSQSSQATIACLMLAYSFSPKVRKYLLGSPIFPRVQKYPAGVLCGVPSGRLPQHRKAVLRNDIECFARKGTKGGDTYSKRFRNIFSAKNNILTLYARSSIII